MSSQSVTYSDLSDITYGTAAPPYPHESSIFIDINQQKMFIYLNGTWVQIGGSGGGGGGAPVSAYYLLTAVSASLPNSVVASAYPFTNDDIAGLDWSKLSGVPGSFTPAAHEHTHVTGESDAFLGGDLLDATARVSVSSANQLIGTRRKINLVSGSNISITGTDNSGSEEVDLTISASTTETLDWGNITGKPTSFVPATHKTTHTSGNTDAFVPGDLLDATAKVSVSSANQVIGTRRKINFVSGSNINITGSDNVGSEEVDLTVSAVGSFVPAAHKTTHLSGNSDAFTSGDTLDATAKVQVASANTVIGTRRQVNFIAGSNVAIAPVDNSGSERVDVTIAVPTIGSTNLASLSDVLISTPADGQVLTYEASSGKWKNKAASTGYWKVYTDTLDAAGYSYDENLCAEAKTCDTATYEYDSNLAAKAITVDTAAYAWT